MSDCTHGIEFPHSDVFTVLMPISERMHQLFTDEEIKIGAKVNFFSVLASNEELDAMVPGEVTVQSVGNLFPSIYPHGMIRVFARLSKPTEPQEDSSAQA